LPCDAGFDFFGSERAKGSRKNTRSWPQISNRAKGSSFLHIALAQRRRVRLFRLEAREGFEKKHAELAAAPEGSNFRVGAVTNRKNQRISGPGKIDFQERLSSQKINFFAAGAQMHF